jgi:vesicle-associated membrane protein 7
MAIEFVAVARGSVILAAFAAPGVDLERDVQSFLEQPFVINEQRRTNYHIFTFYKHQALSFVCSSPPEVDKKIPLRFLETLSVRFNSAFPNISASAPPHSLTRQAQSLIASTIKEIAGVAAKTEQLKHDLDQTHGLLNESLQKALGRGEDLQLLTEASERVMSTSEDFRNQSKALRQKMCWQYAKGWAFRIIIVLIVVYLILRWICGGWTLPRCRPGETHSKDV